LGQAFVHDPLINWRLLGADKPTNPSGGGAPADPAAAAGAGSAQGAGKPAGLGAAGAAGAAGAGRVREDSDGENGSNDGCEQGRGPASTPGSSSEDERADTEADGAGADLREMPASLRPRSLAISSQLLAGEDAPGAVAEALNAKAVKVIARVQQKVTGRDFDPDTILGVEDQVDKLIRQVLSVN
jgi:FKBP12-rapamycin complex-associated protein